MGISLIETSAPASPVSWVTLFKSPFDLAKAGLGQHFLDYMDEMGYDKLLKV
jgi:phenylalanine-4-hydroxylase